MQALHLTQALAMLNAGSPVSLRVVTARGRIMPADNVISLSYDPYKGTRSIKFLRSGKIRTIHDVCIIAINDFDVYL